MTREADVVRILKPYLMAFPSSHIKEDALIIYARALSRLSSAEIEAAMMKLLDTLAYFPAVSQILEAAQSVRVTAEESAAPSATEAWGEIINQAKRNGMERKWDFSCPEIETALRNFGGREMICNMLECDVIANRAQFTRTYNEVCERKAAERKNKEIIDRLPQKQREMLTGKIVQLAEAKRLKEAGS